MNNASETSLLIRPCDEDPEYHFKAEVLLPAKGAGQNLAWISMDRGGYRGLIETHDQRWDIIRPEFTGRCWTLIDNREIRVNSMCTLFRFELEIITPYGSYFLYKKGYSNRIFELRQNKRSIVRFVSRPGKPFEFQAQVDPQTPEQIIMFVAFIALCTVAEHNRPMYFMRNIEFRRHAWIAITGLIVSLGSSIAYQLIMYYL